MHANLIISIVTLSSALTIQTQEPDGQAFNAPEEAVKTLKVALAAKDLNQLGLIFGSRLDEIVNPDRVQATNEFKMVASKIQESNSLVPAGTNRMALQFGAEKDLFPIPLVQSKGKWYFDTAAGVEELINRRIGRNEIEVLEIIRTYVQAQREYTAADRDGDDVLEYAKSCGAPRGNETDFIGILIPAARSALWVRWWQKLKKRGTRGRGQGLARHFMAIISKF